MQHLCRLSPRLLALGGVVIAALAVLVPAPTQAAVRCGTDTIYYSDATKTTVVGRFTIDAIDCGCDVIRDEGEYSIYRDQIPFSSC